MNNADAWGFALFMAGGAMLPVFFAMAMTGRLETTARQFITFAVVSFLLLLVCFRALIWLAT